jgi:hypothetical protein
MPTTGEIIPSPGNDIDFAAAINNLLIICWPSIITDKIKMNGVIMYVPKIVNDKTLNTADHRGHAMNKNGYFIFHILMP